MKKLHLLLLVALISFLSCNDCKKAFWESCDGDSRDDFDAYLYANYENAPGGQSALTVDMASSSPEINIESDPTITESNGRIQFNYSGVTFREDRKVYRIDDIVTERKNLDTWLVDDENFLKYSFSKSLDIVLVLDVSSSLGENIATIKANAKQMLSDIATLNPEAGIAVVKFSRGNVSKGFQSSLDELNQFIDEESTFTSSDLGAYTLEGRQETALYEAVNRAIELLDDSNARGKGILTFTDGVSNYQFDPKFQNPTGIIDQLNASGIASYTIGYEGNQNSVDKNALEKIAVNGDFSFPKNLSELGEVFERFSNSVAAVYDLVYDTNNAKFEGELEYRFLFNTTLISD